MPELLGQHELITVPSYRLITVRDQDNDDGTGLDEAITEAQTAVVASTGYELVHTSALRTRVPERPARAQLPHR